ncbi:hypothetical protein CYMTET_28038 [Cymbomonas tetramitiformis]|uniref:Uncharacterized protein n=1 Tax=Cymbomonas tetramitiformis TaxID=36881 RepID=A0AAE0FNS4_9CHLO|nr:hypothetical protein CYMTET_28038 [Cymbomonas tetramitiformis]
MEAKAWTGAVVGAVEVSVGVGEEGALEAEEGFQVGVEEREKHARAMSGGSSPVLKHVSASVACRYSMNSLLGVVPKETKIEDGEVDKVEDKAEEVEVAV